MDRPTIVCLCGSTRFWKEFQRQGLAETMAGRIVLSIGAATGTDDEHFGNLPREEYDRVKTMLDELHKRKIDLADEILVLNVDGYVGDSTRSEIEYAHAHSKRIRWLEPDKALPLHNDPASAQDEPQTCPRRMHEIGPWEYKENLDRWVQRGPDRVCSFCGSMHPDDFEKVLDRALVDDAVRIDQSTKDYKVYIHRPEIGNAGDGAIKFYKQHIPDDPEHVTRVAPKFAKAASLSRDRLLRYMEKANEVMAKVQFDSSCTCGRQGGIGTHHKYGCPQKIYQ